MQIIYLLYFFMSLVALSTWVFQISTAFVYKRKKINPKSLINKSISVIIPCYNEKRENVLKTIHSVYKNNIENIEIIIIDDGSAEPLNINTNSKLKIIHLAKNQGKRNALEIGINASKNDITILLDSDTELDSKAIKKALQAMQEHKIDAVCGNILLRNERENFLTFLIASMYYVSFNFERGSQSLFKTVTCCSGGFSVYKTEDLKSIASKINNQKIFSIKSKAGDDRHITSLLLLQNKKIIWEPEAIAYTETPSKYPKFIKQQKRWARSLVLECIWLYKQKNKMNLFYKYDMSKKIFKIIYLLFTYFMIIYWTTTLSIQWIMTILMVLLIKTTVLYIYSKSKRHSLSLILMGLLSYFLLTPILLYASITPFKTKWMTRQS